MGAANQGRPDLFNVLQAWASQYRCVIDRPKGSRHPRYPEIVYTVDYGYLEGTSSADGEGMDVFCGAAGGSEITGVFVTIDQTKRDVEIKVVVGCTPLEVAAIDEFLSYMGLVHVYLPAT